MMIKRDLENEIRTLSKEFPVVTVLGPRQSGKTTLVRGIFSGYRYVSLEDPDNRVFAKDDPRGFIKEYGKNVIFDEIQRVPDLFSYLQTHIDEYGKEGMFILTGSHNYLLMEKITQSLAGRVGISTLLPFSYKEISRQFNTIYLDELLFTGGYPRIYDKKIRPTSFYRTYLNTYIEKDVRLLKNITNYDLFIKFMRILAGRTGQLLNTASVADECGISHNTVKDWLSILSTSYILFKIQPYYENFNKRLVKNPKLYFYDTGLVCYLLGLKSSEDVKNHYLKGAIFETFIFSELMKHNYNNGENYNFYFWRDNHGKEIDGIIEEGTRMMAIEIKSGTTINNEFFSGLNYWNHLAKDKKKLLFLIYGGESSQKRTAAEVISFRETEKIFNRKI